VPASSYLLTVRHFTSLFLIVFFSPSAVPGHEHKSEKKEAHPVSGIDAPGETGVMYVTSRATANGWSAKNNEVRSSLPLHLLGCVSLSVAY
jgi:hypothetical protein